MRLLRSTEIPPYQMVGCHSPRLDDKRAGTSDSRFLNPDTRDTMDGSCEEYFITRSLDVVGEDLSIEKKDGGDEPCSPKKKPGRCCPLPIYDASRGLR
jgi:hypothetical protein